MHSVGSGRVEKEIETRSSWVLCVTFSKKGTKVVAGLSDGKCLVFNVGEWAVLKEISFNDGVPSAQFTDDMYLVTGCYDNVVRTFDESFEQIIGQIPGTYVGENNGTMVIAQENSVKVVDN